MFKSSTSLKRLKAQVVKVAVLVVCVLSAGHSVYYCTVGCPRQWQFRSVMQPRGPLSHASSNASPIHESSPSYLSTTSSTTQYQAVDIYVLMYVCSTYIGSIFWKPKTLQPAADTSHWMSSSGRFFFFLIQYGTFWCLQSYLKKKIHSFYYINSQIQKFSHFPIDQAIKSTLHK